MLTVNQEFTERGRGYKVGVEAIAVIWYGSSLLLNVDEMTLNHTVKDGRLLTSGGLNLSTCFHEDHLSSLTLDFLGLGS